MALDKFQPYLFVSAGEQSNKYLTPTITNGIAQFQAQRAQSLTGLTVRIDPIQEGTGDPSPDNIRPISGRTGMTVTRAGKNIAKPIASTATLAGVSWVVTDDGKVTASGTATANTQVNFNYANNVLQLPKNVPLIISGSTDKLAVRVCYRTTDAPTTTVTLATSYDGADATGTIPENAKDSWVRVVDVAGTGEAVNAECYPMVRISGNSGYEPYTAQEYPISWQTEAGTVYGGTLDVVSGVLTVTHAFKQYTGQSSEIWTESSWTKENTFVAYSNVDLPNSKKEGSRYMCITSCNMLPLMGYDELRNADTNGITITGGTTASYTSVRISKTVASTVAELQTYLASNPLTIVYEFATPQTYNITPADIKTLSGFNQVYSDAGPVIDIKF